MRFYISGAEVWLETRSSKIGQYISGATKISKLRHGFTHIRVVNKRRAIE